MRNIKRFAGCLLVIMLLLGAGSESEYFPVFNLLCMTGFCLCVMYVKRDPRRKKGYFRKLMRSIEIRERTEDRVRVLRSSSVSRLGLF